MSVLPATHMTKTIPILPCLCEEYERGDSANLVVEAKVDGIRAIVRITLNTVQAWTRNGRDIALPDAAVIDLIDLRDHNSHLGDTLTLDCELAGDRLWLFDLPEVKGSYRIRRTALEALFWRMKDTQYDHVRIVPVIYDPELDYGYPEDIDTLVGMAVRERFEGIVLKNPDAPYQQGTRSWHKVKPVRTVDLTVKGNLKNGSLIVDNDGKEVTVGIGLSEAIRAKAKTGAMLGMVIEIRFQEQTESGSLRHPVFVRERTDKSAHN